MAKSIRKHLSKEEKEAIKTLDWYDPDVERPRSRGECIDGIRPCPFVSCSHHLYLRVKKTSQGASIHINWPDTAVELLGDSCVLDVVDENPDGMVLEEIGFRLGVTRERVRQIEKEFLVRIRVKAQWDPVLGNLLEMQETLAEQVPDEGFGI